MKKIITIILLFIFNFKSIGQNKIDNISQYLKSTVTIFLDNNTKSASGFIIEKGKVVTNYHVLEGSKNGYVIVNGTDIKHEIDGYFDYDNISDLAILSVPTINETPLVLSVNSANEGDKVYAFENPILSESIILNGIINYKSSSGICGIIKTTIPITFGNSGGALVNSSGQVIGVFSSTQTVEDNFNSGYATNVSFLKKLLLNKNEIKKTLDIDIGAYYYLNQSMLKFNEKDYNTSLENLNKSIEINPMLFISYYNRAYLKFFLKDIKGVIDDCNKTIEIIPNFVLAYNQRGNAKLKLNDFDGAYKDFNKTIEIDEDFALGYVGKALVYGKKNNIDKAIENFDKAIQIQPKNGFFYVARGMFKFFSGSKKEGCTDLQKGKVLGNLDAQKFIDKFCN